MPTLPRHGGAESEDVADPHIIVDNLAEQALLARLKVSDKASRRSTYTMREACGHISWALDVHRYPLGVPPRRFEWIWGHMLCGCGVCVMTIIILTLMLVFTRGWIGPVGVEDGVLLVSGVASYVGEEPVAATGAVLEQRELTDLFGLTSELLQNVRDVVMMHAGIWRCLHIARVTKYRDGHAMMEAHDGTGIRLRDGRAFVRFGVLGDEEPVSLQPSGNATLDAEWAPPLAFFDIIRTVS